jgi:hypothetical protein
MYQALATDGKPFTFSIYNSKVRAAVKENQSHLLLGDHWADSQVHEVVARNESEALSMIAERYPPEDGFVVETLSPIDD